MWRLHRKPSKFLMKTMSMHEPPIVVPNMSCMKSRKAALSFVDTSRLKSPTSMNGSLGEIRRSVMGCSCGRCVGCS
jgi:hypothetical protein